MAVIRYYHCKDKEGFFYFCQDCFDLAIIEAQMCERLLGKDPDDLKLKDIGRYISSKDKPYKHGFLENI